MKANPQIKDKNKIFAGRSINIPTAKIREISDSMILPKRKPTLVTLKSGKKGTAADRLKEINQEKLREMEQKVASLAKKSMKKKSLSQGGALKPVPTGSQGKGLSKLPTPVRNKMGFMYGGGMPSKKPRVSNTDYRKASKGLLVISIDMMKKKGKGSKGKKKK